MHVRVSDVRALPALISHLVRQGFPATPCGDGVVEILFPAEPAALAAAAELDLWAAANGGATVDPVPARERWPRS
jgi:hypothetical protein